MECMLSPMARLGAITSSLTKTMWVEFTISSFMSCLVQHSRADLPARTEPSTSLLSDSRMIQPRAYILTIQCAPSLWWPQCRLQKRQQMFLLTGLPSNRKTAQMQHWTAFRECMAQPPRVLFLLPSYHPSFYLPSCWSLLFLPALPLHGSYYSQGPWASHALCSSSYVCRGEEANG